MQQYSALIVNLESGSTQIIPNTDVAISIKNNLAFTRGGSFFSSADIINNALLSAREHYDRLVESYLSLYERTFDMSFETFMTYVNAVIEENKKNNTQKDYQMLMYGLGGSSETFGDYSSGLSGDISRFVIYTNTILRKPDWSFKRGVNLVTTTIQRPTAEAKPTIYIQGIQAQHIVNAINTSVLRKGDVTQLAQETKIYQSLSDEDKKAYRIEQNNYRKQNKKELNELESKNYENLLNESLFLSRSGHILEGPTFSVFGIDQNDTVVGISLRGNDAAPRDGNDGAILQSTSMLLLEKAAKVAGLNFELRSVTLEDIKSYKGFYPISNTRFRVEQDNVEFQPVRSIDGEPYCTDPKGDTHDRLAEALNKVVFYDFTTA